MEFVRLDMGFELYDDIGRLKTTSYQMLSLESFKNYLISLACILFVQCIMVSLYVCNIWLNIKCAEKKPITLKPVVVPGHRPQSILNPNPNRFYLCMLPHSCPICTKRNAITAWSKIVFVVCNVQYSGYLKTCSVNPKRWQRSLNDIYI